MTRGLAQDIDIYLGVEGLTGITLSLARDGGTFATAAGAIAEKTGGNGWYTWSATDVDMTFADAVLEISAAGLSDPVRAYLATEPTGDAAVLAAISGLSTQLTNVNTAVGDVAHRMIGIVVQRCWAQDPVTGDIYITSGDTYGERGVPAFAWPLLGINLTDATVQFEVGNAYSKAMTATLLNATLQRWVIELSLSAVDSAAVAAGDFRIRATWADGDRVTLPIRGKVIKQ